MSNQFELNEQIHEEIKAHCARGDQLAETRSFEAAISEYNKAWALVPPPKNNWEASTWILTAIADAAYLGGYLTSAKEAIEYGMTCPGAIGNPFIHLRYGQILLDLHENDRAADELIRAYMGAGTDIFSQEDPKYLAFLKTRAKL
jgi:hypothetical protein